MNNIFPRLPNSYFFFERITTIYKFKKAGSKRPSIKQFPIETLKLRVGEREQIKLPERDQNTIEAEFSDARIS
jgi:hypothetical protein